MLEAVQGWAWSGGGRGIARVDVSVDGHHWAEAELSRPDGQSLTRTWAWLLGIGWLKLFKAALYGFRWVLEPTVEVQAPGDQRAQDNVEGQRAGASRAPEAGQGAYAYGEGRGCPIQRAAGEYRAGKLSISVYFVVLSCFEVGLEHPRGAMQRLAQGARDDPTEARGQDALGVRLRGVRPNGAHALLRVFSTCALPKGYPEGCAHSHGALSRRIDSAKGGLWLA